MDDRFHQGIQEFNSRRFFEAHDVLEDLWHEYRELDRTFLQGLIQVAVGFYHLENGNYKGSCSQFTKGISKLEAYLPHHHGIETEQFVVQVKHWRSLVERLQVGEKLEFKSDVFPIIQYLNNEPTVVNRQRIVQ